MTRIVTNKTLNRFYLTLSGSFDGQDAIRAIKDIERNVGDMQPGFDVITDLRYLKFADIAAALKIKHGTGILVNHGAERIVRVVGSSSFALKVFAKFSSLKGSTTKVYYVPTVEQAEAILAIPTEQGVQLTV